MAVNNRVNITNDIELKDRLVAINRVDVYKRQVMLCWKTAKSVNI